MIPTQNVIAISEEIGKSPTSKRDLKKNSCDSVSSVHYIHDVLGNYKLTQSMETYRLATYP